MEETNRIGARQPSGVQLRLTPELLFDRRGLCDLLRVPESFIRQAIGERHLKVYTIAGSDYFFGDDVATWIRRNVRTERTVLEAKKR